MLTTPVISLLVLLSIIQPSLSGLPSLSFKYFNDIRGQVCFRSALRIQKDLKDESYARYQDYPRKPATVSIESPCYGMAATCCFPQKEEEITYTVRMEYNDKLQAAFDKRTQSCKVVGRGFERVLYTNIRKSMELLKMEISGILHANLSQDLFAKLSDYMYKFVYTRDFCPLREITANQIKKLFRYTFELKKVEDPTLTDRGGCLANLENYFVSTWQNRTLNNLMQLLNNIRLVSESFEQIKLLVNDIREERWSPECASTLFTIKHCAFCAGYDNFHPCDGNCLNVLRGCTADMAELNKPVKQLSTLLWKIGQLVHSELHPMKLIESTLIDYIRLIHHLTQSNYTEIVVNWHRKQLYEAFNNSILSQPS